MKLLRHKIYLLNLFLLLLSCKQKENYQGKIFDAHLHFEEAIKNKEQKIKEFEDYNIVSGAISGPWNASEKYRSGTKIKLLFGLMFPCPDGIMPYGQGKCFEDGKEFPDIRWVRQQILDKKIDFLGELLNEYYGISPSDSIMFPYYALAEEFNLPVGIHTGLAGDNNGCPNYNPSMGDPQLMEKLLIKYPKLKVWIMHAGMPYLKGTLAILANYPRVYIDISVIDNPDIVSKTDFHSYMKSLIDSGFENRLMFGSDGGDYTKMINAVNELDFLTKEQKEKIFYKNAEQFFSH